MRATNSCCLLNRVYSSSLSSDLFSSNHAGYYKQIYRRQKVRKRWELSLCLSNHLGYSNIIANSFTYTKEEEKEADGQSKDPTFCRKEQLNAMNSRFTIFTILNICLLCIIVACHFILIKKNWKKSICNRRKNDRCSGKKLVAEPATGSGNAFKRCCERRVKASLLKQLCLINHQ